MTISGVTGDCTHYDEHDSTPHQSMEFNCLQSTMYAETGVDRISVGSLTKDIQAVDLSMRFYEAVKS